MGFYRDQVLPRIVDLLLRGGEFPQLRARTTTGLRGEVLELGFGSGLNVPHYPAAVTRVLAVDPAVVGRKLAAERLAASPVHVEFVGLDGADLPLDDDSVDHALSTMTLCTIPDVERALGEVRRVLKPGGTLHFLEHGRAPDPDVARRQERLDPVWGRFTGGCHLARRIDDLVAGAGLETVELEQSYLKGPKLFGYHYQGIAAKPAT